MRPSASTQNASRRNSASALSHEERRGRSGAAMAESYRRWSVADDEEDAAREQRDPDQPQRRHRLTLDAEQPEVVDDDGGGKLAGDRRRRHPAGAERAHGDERRRHVRGAEDATGEGVPGDVAAIRDRPQAPVRDRGEDEERGRADRERDERGLQRPDRPAERRVDRRLQGDEPTGDRGEPDRRASVHYLASSQLEPTPTSTASGGVRSPHGATISRSTSARTSAVSPGGPSKRSSSWIVRIIRVASADSCSARAQPIIASFMTSAAVPWMTVLTARRSPSVRTPQLRALSSGIWRRRPNSVVTWPCSVASAIVEAMKAATRGKRSR